MEVLTWGWMGPKPIPQPTMRCSLLLSIDPCNRTQAGEGTRLRHRCFYPKVLLVSHDGLGNHLNEWEKFEYEAWNSPLGWNGF